MTTGLLALTLWAVAVTCRVLRWLWRAWCLIAGLVWLAVVARHLVTR